MVLLLLQDVTGLLNRQIDYTIRISHVMCLVNSYNLESMEVKDSHLKHSPQSLKSAFPSLFNSIHTDSLQLQALSRPISTLHAFMELGV